jgi:DNA-binding transcriptional LysR family regulator
MDLRRLQTFVTVAELGTVSMAAVKLRITQPALSRQLHELQAELRIKLFERVGRRLLLTGEGEQVLADCRDLLNHSQSVQERIQSLRAGDRGVLKLAASPQMIENVLAKFVRRYSAQTVGIELKMLEAVVGDQLAMLERGEVHLAVNVMEVAAPHFGRHPLPPLQVLAAWKPSLPLAYSRDIEVSSFRKLPLLVLNTGFATRRLFDAACRLGRFEPNIAVESGTPHTLLALAEEGLGVAMVPSTVRISPRRLRIARVVYRRKVLESPLVILWDERRLLPRYAGDFIDAFAKYVQQVLPISRAEQKRM